MSTPNVASVMELEPPVLHKSTTLREALRLLASHRSGHACVLHQGRLVGVLSEGDLHRALPSPLAGASRDDYARVLDGVRVARAMTREPATARPTEPLPAAVERMLDLGIHCLPVVENGRLLGLLTERGCLHVLADLTRTRTASMLPTVGKGFWSFLPAANADGGEGTRGGGLP